MYHTARVGDGERTRLVDAKRETLYGGDDAGAEGAERGGNKEDDGLRSSG